MKTTINHPRGLNAAYLTILTLALMIATTRSLNIPGLPLQKFEKGDQINIYASDIGRFSLFDYLCDEQRTTTIRNSPLDSLFDDAIYQTQFKVLWIQKEINFLILVKVYAGINQYCRRLCKRKNLGIQFWDPTLYTHYFKL